ncbi:MAG: response regulator [bacterium]|nr:response regulator [bacterium]
MTAIFNNFSIKKKNIAIILMVVLFSIVTTIVVLGFHNIRTFQNDLISKIESVAKVIGTSSTGAIRFDRPKNAEDLLDKLKVIEEVSAAAIYNEEGEFATFQKDPQFSFELIKDLKGKFQFSGRYLYLSDEIRQDDEKIGTIYIIASTKNLSSQIYNYLLFSTILLVVIFLVAAMLGAWLSKKITDPVLKLADTAATITDKSDFSIRVEKINDDEIGILYDSFNMMLHHIHAKNHEIQKLNESLEDKVEKRTHDLFIAKEQAEDARRAAELADKAKSTFLANMSHEIRTPMNAILGYSRLMMKLITDKTKLEYLQIVETSGKNLLALINDILDLSKIESGKLNLVYKPLNLDRILDEIQNIFKIKTEEKEIDFILEIDPQIPRGLLMDEVRLRQILFNLVGNAVKFTDEGFVKLSITHKVSNVDISCITLLFTVEDTGIGIPAEQIDIIFKAFEQQKNQCAKYGGTGLGLTITKRLVEIMNGTIQVKSAIDNGSTFTIELKDIELSSLEDLPSLHNITAIADLSFNNAQILLVEDNIYNRKLVRAMLKEKKLLVTEAENGRDALEKIKLSRPNLILMDLKMPEMDGYEATRIIKADPHLKDIPVIAFTADLMKDGRKRVKKIGCDGFLSKPVDENRIFSELMKHLPYDHENQTLPTVDEKLLIETGEIPVDPAISLDARNDILTQLTTELTQQWNRLGDSMLLDDWVEFGTSIKNLANKYDERFLKDYSEHLINNVKHLNIVELKKTIKRFPRIVEVYKKGSQK